MAETTTLQWEIDQLVKTKLFPDEQSVVRSALRALYVSQPKLKRQMTLRAYTAGEISLGKAAEMLGVSHEEMKDILREEGAGIHLGPETIDELLRDARHAYRATERTIVELEQEIVRAAQDVARRRGTTIGEVLSGLAQRAQTRPSSGETRHGVPLFPVQPDAGVATLELVNQLRDETP
jgi:predicted HTH domain antitoxin